jgi:histidine triad (HIT) family protein
MSKTIFKRIIDGEIPAKLVHDDELCLAFHDVSPQAPTHILVIPKQEITGVDQLNADTATLLGHIWTIIPQIAKQAGLTNGYRVVVNNGADGGQSVNHLHFHLLGGRQLSWPPG